MPQKGGDRGKADEQKADSVGPHQPQGSLPRRPSEGVPDVEPGEAQVVKLTTEVLETGPEKWDEQPAPFRTEPLKAQPGERHEYADPKGIDDPKRDRRTRE